MAKISIIGLGAMGQALAARIHQQGHTVTVWNRTPGKAAALIPGVREAGTAADAIGASDLTIICVLDYAAVDAIVEVAAPALAGRTLVNLTNGTPAQARDTAKRVTELRAAYLDGGVMATPPMIGGDHALILYSGSKAAFEAHAETLRALGKANYLGEDSGLASLYDLALLAGMCGLFAGALHASALVKSENIPAEEFQAFLLPWLRAMMGSLPRLAAKIDSGEHSKEVASNLAMQVVGIDNILAASRAQGVATDFLEPMRRLMLQRVEDGFGGDDLSGIFELIRSTSGDRP